MKGCGEVSRVVLLRRPTVNHEETNPILKGKPVTVTPALNNPSFIDVTKLREQLSVTNLLQLVGLQDLWDRHGETERLTQIHVLLLQGHQAATKQILVHLAGGGNAKSIKMGSGYSSLQI